MNIPPTFLSIIQKQYSSSKLSTTRELTDFFNSCFREIIRVLNITDKVSLPKACLCSGGELDFGIFKKDKPHIEKNLLCGIEAKGSDPNSSTRAGLKRTDTIKKGISSAYQFKRIYQKLPFFIVTNVIPVSGNAKCMMDLAEGDIIDKFVDVTNIEDLKGFAKKIKQFQ